MEQFATEEQQVEAIKRFWKDNGTAIIIGAVLGLGGLWGWRYYSESQIEAKEQASAQYQSAIEQLENDGANSVEQFISKHPDSGYSNIAGLVLAGKMVNDNNLDGAASQLKQVMDTTSDKHLKSLAGVRLARVQIQQQQADQALSTLNAINDESFKALVAEIKGDAFVQQANMDDARMAYTEALEADGQNQLVQMKLDNLSVATGS